MPAVLPISPAGGWVNPYLSDSLDSFAGIIGQPPFATHIQPRAMVAARTLVPVAAFAPARSGFAARAWSGDYYHRIHATPLTIDAGNVGDPITRTIEVWNAYLGPRTITAISMGQAGLTVTPPSPLPLTLAGLRERSFVLTIAADGAPVIAGLIDFAFSTATSAPSIRVTGQRGALWPFAPLSELIEACEWRTDVVPAYDGEYRVSLRELPLREFGMRHVATQQAQSRARIAAGKAGTVLLPDWPRQYIGAAATGAAVPLPDGPVLIWASETDYEQTSVAAGVLGEVVTPRASVRILPILACRVLSAWQNSRPAGKHSEMSITLQTATGRDEASTSRYALFSGLPLVLDAKCIGSGTAGEGTEWETDTTDNGISLPADGLASANPGEQFTARWAARGADYSSLRAWIYSRRGRYLPFWLPSWSDGDLGAWSWDGSTLTAELFDPRETALLLIAGGQAVPATIQAAVHPVGSPWQITISAAPATVSRVMYLRRVRFAADRIEFRHAAAEPVAVAVQCTRVKS